MGKGHCSILFDKWLSGLSIAQPPDCTFAIEKHLFLDSTSLSFVGRVALPAAATSLIAKQRVGLDNLDDEPCWAGTASGKFSLASVAALFSSNAPSSISLNSYGTKICLGILEFFFGAYFCIDCRLMKVYARGDIV